LLNNKGQNSETAQTALASVAMIFFSIECIAKLYPKI
jgi:hypothetical protein